MSADAWRWIRAAGPGWFADRVAAALGAAGDHALLSALRQSAVAGGAPVTWRGRSYQPAEQLKLLARRPAPVPTIATRRDPAAVAAERQAVTTYAAIAERVGD
jgi:hypothetical protein